MAISDKTKTRTSEASDPASKWIDPYRTWAAAGSMLLGAAAVVALVYSLVAVAAGDVALHVVLILPAAISLCAGAVLRFGSLSAQKQALWILLVYWLLTALAGVLQAFAAMLWDGWSLLPSAQTLSYILAGVEIVLGAAMAILLFRATPPATRDRYGANITISVAVVVAVVVVLNMLSFTAPLEHDFETQGRYGLSERSKRILGEVDVPMHVWAVYTDARMSAHTEEERTARDNARKYLDRVMEMLEEIQRGNPNIVVRDASGDAARANLMAELRTLQQGKTGRQETLLQTVRQEIPAILKELDSLKESWSRLPKDSYLAQWDLGGEMSDMLKDQADKIETADRTVAEAVAASPLPDYVKLLDGLAGELRSFQQVLQSYSRTVQRLGKLPDTIRANADGARKSVDACVKAVEEVDSLVQRGGKDGPGDSGKTLQDVSAALGKAGQAVRDAAASLDTVAGKGEQDVRLVSASRAWQIEIPSEMGVIRTTRSRLFDALAKDIDALRSRAAVQRSDANETAQRRFIVDLRQPIAKLLKMMKENRDAVQAGLTQLTTMDAASQALLDEVAAGETFAPLLAKIDPLLAEADQLKAPKDDALPPDLSGKNIIVLRAGDKVEVVTFDDAWPQRILAGDSPTSAAADTRFFNGDAVLASRILAMTKSEPFGRVLIAYLEPTLPPELRMRIRLPQGAIPPDQLTELTRRLKEANFLVQTWNLDEDMPASPTDAADDETATQPTTQPATNSQVVPTILLVLPPAPPMPAMPGQPPMPSFGPEHLQKIRDAIDDGASSLFLTCYLEPKMTPYGMALPQTYPFAEYLRGVWGLEAGTDFMIVEGIPSDTPGKYQINPVRTSYMPLSTFTSQPIGKPLQGRRMIWTRSCPITDTPDAPEGVVRTPVLTIPETMTNIWGVNDLQRLASEVEGSRSGLVSPQYDKGDRKVPLTLVTAATRSGDLAKGIVPSRLVLLGVGLSLTDMFLTSPIPELTKQGGFEATPPPGDDADLAVNAAYWLVGKESYIAAGPTNVEPVRAMGQATQTTLWVFCVLVLPAAVIAAGLVVMAARKKS